MKFFFVSSVILSILLFGWADSALARLCPKPLSQCEHKWNQPSGIANGVIIPWNGDFPCAEYPYGQHIDACSGFSDPEQVRDDWGPVSFVDACNDHDKCYYTWGSLPSECNKQFFGDLKYACERDLGLLDVPDFLDYLDPRYEVCLSVAASYYETVVFFQRSVHPEAQACQEEYEKYVKSVVESAQSLGPQDETPEGGIAAGVMKDKEKEAVLMLLNQYMTGGF